jgi:hypothetical protein
MSLCVLLQAMSDAEHAKKLALLGEQICSLERILALNFGNVAVKTELFQLLEQKTTLINRAAAPVPAPVPAVQAPAPAPADAAAPVKRKRGRPPKVRSSPAAVPLQSAAVALAASAIDQKSGGGGGGGPAEDEDRWATLHASILSKLGTLQIKPKDPPVEDSKTAVDAATKAMIAYMKEGQLTWRPQVTNTEGIQREWSMVFTGLSQLPKNKVRIGKLCVDCQWSKEKKDGPVNSMDLFHVSMVSTDPPPEPVIVGMQQYQRLTEADIIAVRAYWCYKDTPDTERFHIPLTQEKATAPPFPRELPVSAAPMPVPFVPSVAQVPFVPPPPVPSVPVPVPSFTFNVGGLVPKPFQYTSSELPSGPMPPGPMPGLVPADSLLPDASGFNLHASLLPPTILSSPQRSPAKPHPSPARAQPHHQQASPLRAVAGGVRATPPSSPSARFLVTPTPQMQPPQMRSRSPSPDIKSKSSQANNNPLSMSAENVSATLHFISKSFTDGPIASAAAAASGSETTANLEALAKQSLALLSEQAASMPVMGPSVPSVPVASAPPQAPVASAAPAQASAVDTDVVMADAGPPPPPPPPPSPAPPKADEKAPISSPIPQHAADKKQKLSESVALPIVVPIVRKMKNNTPAILNGSASATPSVPAVSNGAVANGAVATKPATPAKRKMRGGTLTSL